jgi:hypothetical protein
LAKDEDDKKIVRELPATEDGIACLPLCLYKVTIVTADIRGAGTSANVFLQLYGDSGDSGELQLDGTSDSFERGRVDEFGLEIVELGNLQKLRIRHDNKGLGAGWFLTSITVRNEKTGLEWFFQCNKWLDKSEDDGKIARELFPSQKAATVSKLTAYQLTVFTADVQGAGTDANVFCVLYGKNGSTDKITLETKNGFERGTKEVMPIEAMDLGDLTKIRIGHDNKGLGAGWFLDKVVVKNLRTDDEFVFPCNNWLDKAEGDRQIVRELAVNLKK